MNAHTFLLYTASGAIVGWIPLIIGFVVSHRKLKKHIDKVTEAQTSVIATITEAQTEELLPARKLKKPGV